MNNMLKLIYLSLTFVVCMLIYGCAHKETTSSQNTYVDMESHTGCETSDTISEAETGKSQINDTVRFIDIMESSSYPFSENEDDYGKYNVPYSGYDTTVDSMVILSVIRKHRNLTQKEALTIINYATNNISQDADGSICGSTGEAFVNDSQFFDLIVHIARELPDTLKIKINNFLEGSLYEYGSQLIDAGAIDINEEEFEDMIYYEDLPLDSIISLRNSWAEAVKDHPVKYGATE